MKTSITLKNSKLDRIVRGGLIAAIYVVLTVGLTPLSYGPIQFRLSEALCVLPIFLPESIPALFIGCIIANLLSPFLVLDVVFGSIATLIGAFLTRALRKKPLLSLLPPVVLNGISVGFVIAYTTSSTTKVFWANFTYNMLTVAAGEFVSCYIFGFVLYKLIKKYFVFL